MKLLYLCLVCGLVALATKFLIAASYSQRVKSDAGTTYFHGSNFIRVLFGVGVPTFLYGAGSVALSPSARTDWWVSLILSTVALGSLYYWPRQIVTNSEGIVQEGLFGLGGRSIPWPEVDYVVQRPDVGSIEVVSVKSFRITLNLLYIGQDEFLSILKEHGKVAQESVSS